MEKLGNLEKIVDLRTIWKNEERDFSKWLSQEKNLKLLSDTIGIDIELDSTESPVGNFSVDIYGQEAGTDRMVVIENQLEDTNHDHLGKIITYASGKDAKTVIWIVKRARDEHRKAIEWLNEHIDSEINFFLLEIEVWKIGNSQPAPKFNVVCKPNGWGKAQRVNSELGKANKLQLEFWQAFADYAENDVEYSKVFNKRTARPQHWYSLPMGSKKYHLSLTCDTLKKEVSIQVYIGNNKEIFDNFYANKDEIENKVGLEFEWQRLENAKASRIKTVQKCNAENRDEWEKTFRWFCKYAPIIRKVFQKYRVDE